jgi:hypothetical protein
VACWVRAAMSGGRGWGSTRPRCFQVEK